MSDLNLQSVVNFQIDAIANAKFDLLLWKYFKPPFITRNNLHELSVVLRLQILEEEAERQI